MRKTRHNRLPSVTRAAHEPRMKLPRGSASICEFIICSRICRSCRHSAAQVGIRPPDWTSTRSTVRIQKLTLSHTEAKKRGCGGFYRELRRTRINSIYRIGLRANQSNASATNYVRILCLLLVVLPELFACLLLSFDWLRLGETRDVGDN